MSILVLHKGEPRFNVFKQQLLHPTIHKLISGALVCQDKIGEQFVRDAINQAQIIVVNLFNGIIIGFAAVIKDRDEYGNPFLYIELICNSPPPGFETRAAAAAAEQRQGAKAMIEAIERLARERGCSYVKLSAVDDVIPYYYRLGYDFITVYSELGEINKYLKDKAHDLIADLRGTQLDQDMEKQEKLLIKIIQRYYPGYLSENYQSSVASAADAAARIEPAQEAGIPMIKKMMGPGPVGPAGPAGPAEPVEPAGRGGKKHKRKTIRKKYSRNKQRGMLKKSRKYRRRV